jgi:hypothetical protein
MTNDTLLTYDEWNDKYIPATNPETDDTIFYETYSPHIDDLKNYAEQIAKEQGTKPYQYIWSRVDGDSGKLILLNGWHICNRLDYCISHTPWGDGTDNDKDTYIEVTYED